ncbi:flagellar protein FlbD [Vulcanibacillus modesticaldus]|uniref:Flagellar protein FlbD n=1 Tax=Vulcanibacillus modesticaldus TaxID=337097 RepID=A0A1D2YXH0_9BACI|nr:flagellar FlbD family protein [Vulcanibacillus modesticaldus]OEG00409.1 flagellar protein FlbD [Vulcanibacillus modesticaldus]
MIYVNRLDGSEFVINPLLIETIEKTPDTIITLTNGKRYIVKQTLEEIIEQFEAFIKRTHSLNVN